jgi:hypothetical protein
MREARHSPRHEHALLWSAIHWIEELLIPLAGKRDPASPRLPCGLVELPAGDLLEGEKPPHPRCVPKLEELRQKFGLGVFESDLLLLCAAVELDPALGELCAAAQPGATRPYPTPSLAFRLFHDVAERPEDRPSWAALSPNGPLLHWRLVELVPAGSTCLAGAMLKIDPRILLFLLGLDGDDRDPVLAAPLARLLTPLEAGPYWINEPHEGQCKRTMTLGGLASSQIARTTEIAALLAAPQRNAVAHLLGNNAEAKRLVVRGALAVVRFRTDIAALAYRLALDEWPVGTEDVATFARLWLRERRLDARLYLFLDGPDLDQGDRERNALLDELLSRIDEGPIIVATREPRALEGRDVRLFDVDKPKPAEQKRHWAARLAIHQAAAGVLVSRFHFNFPAIDALCDEAGSAGDADVVVARVLHHCRHWTRPRLGSLAERIEPRAERDDLVLPAPEMKLIDQIADQVRHLSMVYDDWGVREAAGRGLGLGVLFAGESGTGKTFAAEVLAASLQLDLYRIDLSAVVDKYIGETEKNLRRLFDAAEDGGCILLFDEADALFGKRSEVKDSHDRYANIQVNYLLQRVESFRGLAILTTNRKSALDTAFLRRLRFVVNFPFPAQEQRQQMWEKTLPADAGEGPRVPVALAPADYEVLARLSLTGGNIRTVALNAAFLAAALGRRVDLEIVKEAARVEYRKLGREAPPELRERPRLLKEIAQ